LDNHPKSNVVVFAVWEPILLTDWSAPGTSVLDRLHDRRVRQFWDPNHLAAAVLKRAEAAGQLHPNCCNRNGVLWDLTSAYPPGPLWRETLPPPVVFDGPVVQSFAGLESFLAKAK
jgi:hypothetical protein